jgi:hypothetical protein
MTTRYLNDKGVQYVRDSLATFPRPDQAAAAAIRHWAGTHGLTLDPDTTEAVTLHYQFDPARGWVGVITEKMTLTQAVLANWQGESSSNLIGAALGKPWGGALPEGPLTIVDALRGQGLIHYGAEYSVYNGLFRQTGNADYSARTHVQLPAEAFQAFIWQLDFHHHYKASLDRYWAEGLDTYRKAAKISFITACNKQVSEGSLSDAGRRLAWQAAGLERPGPALRANGKPSRKPRICASLLNVYGYVSTDLLCLQDTVSALTLLYVPGNASPLHEFSDQAQMQDWLAGQCQDPRKREAVQAHFALADREDGLSYSGLHTALSGLGCYPQPYHLDSNRAGFTTEGIWSPRDYINYKPTTYSPPLSEDLFLALARRHKQRSYRDADFIVTSNSDVTKAKWRGYLDASINLLAPLALVVPELTPLFAAAGAAQFGLGLDQAINAKHAQAKAEGVSNAVFGLLNAVPLIHAGVTRAPALFSFKYDGFVVPSRINEQLGYPLSPLYPPKLPLAAAAEVEDYFHLPGTVAPLPGADPLVAGAVLRTPRYNGMPDTLSASIDDYFVDVVYDVAADAFILESDLNEVDPTYFQAAPGSRDLVPVTVGRRTVSNEMRANTLRALGIDLQLPVQLPLPAADTLRPIPRQILNIWVGNRVIEDTLLANLARNAELIRGSGYTLRLYLSTRTPTAYQENLRLLADRVPDVRVLPLEDQPFYARFRASDNYLQYAAAIDGNGGVASNYASASDILRYALLEAEGGLYLDVDDSLLAAGERPATPEGTAQAEPGEALVDVELSTSHDGLLLYPPMANETKGMRCLYNNSMIGSHPGNPTLRAILEEMHARYLDEPSFYDSKPLAETDRAGFYRYATTLSRLTGPQLLSDVIDQRLPLLRVMRQVTNLYAIRRINAYPVVDLPAVQAAQRQLLPLNRVARVGAYGSWARP